MTSRTPSSAVAPVLRGEASPVYDEMKRHEIRVLRTAGEFSHREIARRADVSLDTVLRVLEEGSSSSGCSRAVGRPPVVRRHQDLARAVLEEEPHLPTVEVLRRVRERGYAGSKTPFYAMVRGLRNKVEPLLVRFEGLAGEFSQNDFGQVRVKYLNGETEIVHFFAARLKWSRWVHVEIVPNEQVESLSRALLHAFESFGGVPLACVFDNPKTVVVSRLGRTIQWNETFQQVAMDYRFACELCTPERGKEKGSVENLVGFAKNGFFKVRRFLDREDLAQQLTDWHREVNLERPCRATKEIPAARIEVERERLRPVPIPPSEYALRFPVRVGPTAEVSFHGVRYSMPAVAMGLNATLYHYPERVGIMTDKFDETHPRAFSSLWPSTRSRLFRTRLGTGAPRTGRPHRSST
jgi:transposase